MTRDSPFAAIMTPSVATKGGTFILEIVTPLMRPASAPVAIPPAMPAGIGSPQLLISTPIMTADRVITVPTDKSMPAVMMTKVAPRPRIPLTVVASKMPTMLSKVRK